jgi:hypothetical protein
MTLRKAAPSLWRLSQHQTVEFILSSSRAALLAGGQAPRYHSGWLSLVSEKETFLKIQRYYYIDSA